MLSPAGIRRSLILIVALLLGPRPVAARLDELPSDPRQESALLDVAGPTFELRKTPHFLVAYNTDRSIVDDFVVRIESTYRAVYHFCDLGQIASQKPDRRLEIIFFDRPAQYTAYASQLTFPCTGTFGFYYLPTNRSAFFNVLNDPQMLKVQADIAESRQNLESITETVKGITDRNARIEIRFSNGRVRTLTRAEALREIDTARSRLRALDDQRENYSERINATVVQHEVAHQVLFNAGVHARGGANPKWIAEGLACMFETPPSAGNSGLAATNQLRLHDFRKAIGTEAKHRLTGVDFVAAVRAGRFPEFPALVSDPTVFDERGPRGAVDYAAAWALTHYLQRTRMPDLAAYLKAIAARSPDEKPTLEQETALFEKHFGRLDSSFLTRLGDYILRLPVRSDR